MSEQLAYAVITPYSLSKFRTGGIIARLITRTGLHLVGARMYAPSKEFASEYAMLLRTSGHSDSEQIRSLLGDYVENHFGPDPKTGQRHRIMVLLLQGEDAIAKVHEVIGAYGSSACWNTICGTYGDLILDENDSSKVVYFEPAVLGGGDEEGVSAAVKLFAKYDSDGGILRGVERYPEGVKPQLTLAMIKPENFRFPTGRPGNIIDSFSRAGLNIVGIKVQRMSTAQAVEFYGPVREVLCTKLNDRIIGLIKPTLEKALSIQLGQEVLEKVANDLGEVYGQSQFDNIIRFMSGRAENECPADQLHEEGTAESIVLLFEGPDAIAKIRTVLGPTDPSKAPPGSIRREFGTSVMVNAAHASDSEESVRREMGILLDETHPNHFLSICRKFYP